MGRMIAALAVLVAAAGCTTSTSSRYVKVVSVSDQTPERQAADAQACDAVADAQYQEALDAWRRAGWEKGRGEVDPYRRYYGASTRRTTDALAIVGMLTDEPPSNFYRYDCYARCMRQRGYSIVPNQFGVAESRGFQPATAERPQPTTESVEPAADTTRPVFRIPNWGSPYGLHFCDLGMRWDEANRECVEKE